MLKIRKKEAMYISLEKLEIINKIIVFFLLLNILLFKKKLL